MLIEITEKERTALSILLGLRQKFAREQKDKVSYTAYEMHKLFSELISKINSGELKYCDTMVEKLHKREADPENVWDIVDEAIERSKIKRYDWNIIFGHSLTKEILTLKKIGLSVNDAFKELSENALVKKFIEQNKRERKKILKNLEISVHARYGENNTAQKVMGEIEE